MNKIRKRGRKPSNNKFLKIGVINYLNSSSKQFKEPQYKRYSSRISVKRPVEYNIDLEKKDNNLLKKKHKREWIKRGMNCNWTVIEVLIK